MKLHEEKLSEKLIYDGRIIKVHVDEVKLENEKTSKREVVDHNGGVCVAVLTEKDELLLVRQFRYPYGEVLLEVPAGKLELGEDPFEAMKREQKEETGTTGKEYISLGQYYPSPGYCGEIIYMWACREDRAGELKLDEDEFLEVVKMPLAEAVDKVLQGEIPDGKTQTAILKTAALLKSNRI
ncbi:NUDIX domain-containing protein [Scatolibacter rhodanostii]|uniref:NUDIX domain-containing protein n=1 Tax=Scatolibacter rhodanostii TaxID=2014781 RepID=UPI000C08A311|nr:NUDIX hydrolase [Scatolibacter rhodanostii]